MDTEEAALVRETARRVLADTSPDTLILALEELGLGDLVDEDPQVAVGALFEEQGRSHTAAPTLDLVVLRALGLPTSLGAVIYPTFVVGTNPPARRSGSRIVIDGIALTGMNRTDAAVMAVGGERGGEPEIVRVDATSLDRRTVGGFDPDLGLIAVAGELDSAAVEPTDLPWGGAVKSAQRALAHEILGASEAMLTIAVDHVRTREQFGAPIAVFQAVKHRLADVHVAIAAAHASLRSAWLIDDPPTAALAKLLAGEAGARAARECQQVCGGMGFTWEFPLHRHIRRSFVLGAFLGSTRELRVATGDRSLDEGFVPRLDPRWPTT